MGFGEPSVRLGSFECVIWARIIGIVAAMSTTEPDHCTGVGEM
jgi:hypothetical protein